MVCLYDYRLVMLSVLSSVLGACAGSFRTDRFHPDSITPGDQRMITPEKLRAKFSVSNLPA